MDSCRPAGPERWQLSCRSLILDKCPCISGAKQAKKVLAVELYDVAVCKDVVAAHPLAVELGGPPEKGVL